MVMHLNGINTYGLSRDLGHMQSPIIPKYIHSTDKDSIKYHRCLDAVKCKKSAITIAEDAATANKTLKP